ncbi:PREDICTED: rho GTPase-activating protein 4 isoform X4 [Cercocebus atys]|uniref:rho GTPase-activating protein 4 isoform X4 n=1 Tax=Cercocebus atys TaxID=9531 RepID=UPI0005F485B8|nr:PREDICTED: rho GTPase-activating protein 4 isoform X4 [Cercocebus atys]
MAAHGKLRRERGLQAEYETQVKEMRWQLSEQLRCLELQGELRRELLQELAEFMRRRAEVELEYSRGLEKLAERFSSRGGRLGSSREHQSFRKEPSLLSPLHCWAVLLQHTRQQSRESAALSEVLAGPLAQRLSHIAEDVGRLVKKAKKTYQAYHMESVNAEAKLREAERQEEKRAGRSVPITTAAATEAGPLRKSSLKKGGRLVEKRQAKFMEHKLKCTKARNEYLLSLASVNAAVSNYYLHDVLDLMDCCDTGFHLALGQVLRSYMAAESRTQASQVQGLGSLEEAVEALDPSGDKAKVLEVHATIFCPPLRFDYHPHDGDEVAEICVEMELQDEILPRAQNIQSRLDRQTIETEEVNKTLKATLQALLEVVASDDGDVLDSFQTSPSTESLKSTSSDPGSRQAGRRRGQQQETETFYLTKLQEYLSGRSILAKLQAKHEKLQEALQRGDKEEREMSWTQYTQRKFQKSRHPRPSSQYNQRLFGGDMEKFIQCSGQPVPLVVESCIRFINLNGLQHEGIFRVSGAQLRVSEIRDAFERGEDPLVEGCTAHDLDSVAGVLKLYFRSLEPPLFPPDLFSELLASSELEATAERVEHVSRLLWRLPAPVLVVLRYLFNFLNHLAQYSDENMMDPYNLAVCFGPTLLPVPAGQDPVALQGRVNQLVQTLILQPDRVFPPLTSLPGPVYEKCMAPPSASCLGDAQLESLGADNEPELEAEMLAQEDGQRSRWWAQGRRLQGSLGAVLRASWHQSWFTGQSHASHPRPWDSLDIDDAAWSQPPRSNTWRWIRPWHRTWTLCLRSSWERPLSARASGQHLPPLPALGPEAQRHRPAAAWARTKASPGALGPQPHPQHPTPRAWTQPPSHTEVLLLELCAPGGYPLDRPLSPALLLLSNPVQQVQGACTSPCAEVGWGRTCRDAHSTPCLPLSPGPDPFWRLGKALFCDFVEGWSVAAGWQVPLLRCLAGLGGDS